MAKRGEYVRPQYTLICQWCGEKFTSAHDWARYCSDKHRMKASRERKKKSAEVECKEKHFLTSETLSDR